MKRISYYLMLGLKIQATLITPVSVSRAQENELDSLFDDEFESDMGAPIPPPPPPPGDQSNFDTPPPPPPPENYTPPPAGGGGFAPSNRPAPKVTGTTKAPAPGKGKTSIAHAGIEDITNENFPDLIDSFDYPNADIADIVKAISELTGKNFIIDPGVRGKITIVAPTQITVAEAYKAFLSALAMNNFTIVPSGKFLKIVPVRTAARSNIETYSGAYYPDADVMITRIAKLKHISAEEVNKNLRFLPTKDGEMNAYAPTNSLIITDYGSNIDRIMKILRELDQPGFEEQLAVIPVRYAKAKEIADLIMQIINKESKGSGGAQGGFNAGVPRFRPPSARSGTPEEYSMVAPDERTNAIIVLGNKTGIQKVRDLIKKLDYKLDPSETGGVFVYYVRYGEAEKLATVFTGIAAGSGAPGGSGGGGGAPGRPFVSPVESRAVFTNDVKVTPDKQNNSLVITASRQDYQVVRSILAKLDIPRDQVYVEAYVVEMQSSRVRDWQVNYVRFEDNGSGGAGLKSGFVGSSGDTLAGLLSPTGGQGAILGFGFGDYLDLKVGSETLRVPSILSLINILVTQSAANLLSTPQILALDNEDAEIEVGERIAVSQDSTPTSAGVAAVKTTFDDATIKLMITPFISPDTDDVQMKITQSVKQPSNRKSSASGLANNVVNMTTRSIKTNIVVASGNTAVLGGLIQDQELNSEAKIPILGDIPVLGWLFKSSNTSVSKINLNVFLTPKIIRSGTDHQRMVNRKKAQRIDWVKKNQGGRDPFAEVVDQLPSRTGSDVIRDPANAKGFKKNRRAKN